MPGPGERQDVGPGPGRGTVVACRQPPVSGPARVGAVAGGCGDGVRQGLRPLQVPLLDPSLDIVPELHAPGGEQLDAVVVKRVVGGRDHGRRHAAVSRHPGHGRCRQHPKVLDLDTGGGQTPGQSGGQGRARLPGVGTDDESRPAQNLGRGQAERYGHRPGDFGFGSSPYPVGAECGDGHARHLGRKPGTSACCTAEPCGPS